MSIASSFVSSFKRTNNKDLVRRHAIAKSTFKRAGDDFIRYFTDGSAILDRTIVNEIQLFKGQKMTSKIIKAVKSIFFKEDSKSIFSHKANGEQCHVCGRQMLTNQGITMVGSGEKMHSKCWVDFFTAKVDKLRNAQANNKID